MGNESQLASAGRWHQGRCCDMHQGLRLNVHGLQQRTKVRGWVGISQHDCAPLRVRLASPAAWAATQLERTKNRGSGLHSGPQAARPGEQIPAWHSAELCPRSHVKDERSSPAGGDIK